MEPGMGRRTTGGETEPMTRIPPMGTVVPKICPACKQPTDKLLYVADLDPFAPVEGVCEGCYLRAMGV